MSVELAANSYGKSAIRLFKVVREGGDKGGRHVIRDFTVDVSLSGRFAAAHIAGDNSEVLPTDTMKNTVYAKAREIDIEEPEGFALRLAHHFLGVAVAADMARVHIMEHGWRRLDVGGKAHDYAFARSGPEKRVAHVEVQRSGGIAISAGLDDLVILKSAQSAFAGFPRDRYTTLAETSDRILATSLRAVWAYRRESVDFRQFEAIRQHLLETFAGHESASVQHTLYAMGEAVLERCPDVAEITITMPNRHHLLVDLRPFDLDNENEIFVPTEAPYGLIEATLRRAEDQPRLTRP
jgi:urate oxidase